MRLFILTLALLLSFSSAFAHEMVPTYPKWRNSYIDDLLVTQMEMFNKRNDVEYFEVAVFDQSWNPIPFVTSFRVFKLEYLSRVTFDVYIRQQDKNRARYICSRSKTTDFRSGVTSMICSKFKEAK